MTMKIEDAGVRKALRWALAYVLAVLVLGGGIGGCVRTHREKMPLRGELQVKDGTKVLLFVPFLRELGAIDSAEVRDGQFAFSNGSLRGVYVFSVPNEGEWLVYLSETPTHMCEEATGPMLAQPYGDTLNWVLRENHLLVRDLGAKMHELSREYDASKVDGDRMARAKAEALDAMWERANAEFAERIVSLVSANVDNAVGIFLLRQYKELFSPELLRALGPRVEKYARAHGDDAHAAALLVTLRRNENLLQGASVPPVVGIRVDDGVAVRLDSLVREGSETLVQFWSPGDGESVAALGSLLRAHGGQRLRVVGVCMAPSREEALEYVKLYGAEGINILCNSEISEEYGVLGGARNFLYGEDGRLQRRDASIDELEERLRRAQQ